MTKELTVQQFLWQRTTIDWGENAIDSATVHVHIPRRQFLTRSSLTKNQHRGVRSTHPFKLLERLGTRAAAWHFCLHTNAGASAPLTLLTSLAAQLCERHSVARTFGRVPRGPGRPR